MSHTRRPLTRRLGVVACGVVLAATLAACGHSHSAPPAPAPSAVQQFISFVTSIVNKANADTTEPDDISSVTAATTDTEEPTSL